jgi:hypothetical protein
LAQRLQQGVRATIDALLGLDVHLCGYRYDIGPVDNSRAAALLPAFARPSWQTLNLFIDQLGAEFVGRGRLDDSVPAR